MRNPITRTGRTLAAAAGMTAALAGATAAQAEPQTFKIDEAHSDIAFMITHFGYSDAIGEFTDFSGTFTIDKENPDNAAVNVTIQADSVDTQHDKRDEHIRSPDFLNVKEYPEITFTSTDVEKTGENTAEITGELTLHGTTKPVTLDVTLNKLGEHPLPQYNGILTAGISARGTIERSDFGVSKYTPAIGDEMELLIEIEGFAQDQLDKLPE
ncbi:Polyisoprenoid-binding protein YceI [Limimonas halophila]|uniref:Polyisoprenoid-binding protein YceI n=1 Tax=Limimonas halophila TaxID=1082479 RepID=A0A1G7TT34_9PROT|nr:YceI family protein [Limimonas halophila]SDG38493.1 Polyisoprenoid-binding protein YceI [Limimonas halophila]